MTCKKCIAFLCAVVLLAAVLTVSVSAASASGTTVGGNDGSVEVTASLAASPAAGQASTTPAGSVVPSWDTSTVVRIECHSIMTGDERFLWSEGSTSAYVYRPDTTYSVWRATSTHVVNNDDWGFWRTELIEEL